MGRRSRTRPGWPRCRTRANRWRSRVGAAGRNPLGVGQMRAGPSRSGLGVGWGRRVARRISVVRIGVGSSRIRLGGGWTRWVARPTRGSSLGRMQVGLRPRGLGLMRVRRIRRSLTLTQANLGRDPRRSKPGVSRGRPTPICPGSTPGASPVSPSCSLIRGGFGGSSGSTTGGGPSGRPTTSSTPATPFPSLISPHLGPRCSPTGFPSGFQPSSGCPNCPPSWPFPLSRRPGSRTIPGRGSGCRAGRPSSAAAADPAGAVGLLFVLVLLVTVGVIAAVFVAQVFHGS